MDVFRSKALLEKIALYAVIVLLVIIFAYPLINHELIYGYDSPFYVAIANRIDLNNIQLFGTHIPILFPLSIAVLKGLANISIISSIKIMAFLTSIAMPLTIYLFSRKKNGKLIALITLFIVVSTPAYFRMTQDLFNNLLSFTFLIVSLYFATKTYIKSVLISGIFLALSFWSHSLTPIIAVQIYVLFALLVLIYERSIKRFLYVCLIVAIGIILSAPQSLMFLFGQPTGSDDPQFYIFPLIVDSVKKLFSLSYYHPDTLFPRINDFFSGLIRYYTFPVMLATIAGLIVFIRKPKKNTTDHILFAAFAIPFIMYTVAALGIIGFGERYLLYLYFPSSVLSANFLVSLRDNKSVIFNKKAVSAIIPALFLFYLAISNFPTLAKEVLTRGPNITSEEYVTFKEVSERVNMEDLVLLNNLKLYWFWVANPNLKTSIYEYYVTQWISEQKKDFGYYHPQAEYSLNALIMAKNNDLSQLEVNQRLCNLINKYNSKDLYIFVNLNEPGVNHQRLQNQQVYKLKFKEGEYSLYQFNNQLCSNTSR